MHTTTLQWSPLQGWQPALATCLPGAALVLGFGARAVLAASPGPWDELVDRFPGATCAVCSTAGEIFGERVRDGTLTALCVHFSTTRVAAETVVVASPAHSFAAAAGLARQLLAPDLRHLLVLSDGLLVNGTSLTAGFRSVLPPAVRVTGGLAGDGPDFKQTFVGLGHSVGAGRIVALGFYGEHLQVACGSAGGWEAFGPSRLVTRSAGNVLYCIDDQPALALYKRYLGERAAGLPGTGLLFPLQLIAKRGAADGLVRTILAVDEPQQSLTFAGDIPEGHYVRLMRAGGDALVTGAGAAAAAADPVPDAGTGARFAVLVSCVGRRLVLGQRIEEEVETVLRHLGAGVAAIGFYSYGEICPSGLVPSCDLHNQTMTLSVFSEPDTPNP